MIKINLLAEGRPRVSKPRKAAGTSLSGEPANLWLVIVLALAVLVLPITPDASLKPPDGESPVLRITAILALSVGLPYLLLASTGPLLQGWFAKLTTASPYRLYALSNAGGGAPAG